MHNRFSPLLFIMAAVTGITASAQTSPAFDNSGNGKLNGTYYFRHVLWALSDTGDLSDAQSLYGTISFDGNGHYTINNGTIVDASEESVATGQTITGTYTISASGYGYIDNPFNSFDGLGDEVYGLVTNQLSPGSPGIFMGSSTETQEGYNDLFIAAPLASPLPTASSLNGTYVIVGIDNPSLSSADARDYQVTFTANGAGKFTVPNQGAFGYVTSEGGSLIYQSIGTQSYNASSGAFSLTFTTAQLSDANLLTGQHFLYMSPDGNFIFGGSPEGWDMFVGVKQTTNTSNFTGVFYQAGMDLNITGELEGYDESTPDSYYGSLVPLSGSYLLHQRLNNQFNNNGDYTEAYDYTANDPLSFNSNGTEDDPFSLQHYIFGANGAIRIGVGNAPFLGIQLAIQAPTFSGSGVYINPTGIQNAANSALFTAGLAPGELITISGTGFPTGPFTNPGLALNTTLGGTQVLIDGIAAPIYYVTGTLIAAQVPFEVGNASSPVLSIQVTTPQGSSNVVTVYQNATQPSIYTIPAGGNGLSAAVHISNNSLVTTGNPAVPNESLYVYTNGFGAVSPAVADGAPASSTTLSSANNTIAFDILDPNTFDTFPSGGGGTPSFAGLAPPYAGLYQMNFTVPSTDSSGNPITAGNNNLYLELYGFDMTVPAYPVVEAYNSQSLIAVNGSATVETPAAIARGRRGPDLSPRTRKIIHSKRVPKRQLRPSTASPNAN
jgi:uncharacterized protein (TIGR03437 family)